MTRECRRVVVSGSPTGLRRIADMWVVVFKCQVFREREREGEMVDDVDTESACMNAKFKGW